MRYALIFILLSGCATDTYWVRAVNPVEVKHIAHVDLPCGRFGWSACWNPAAQTIEVKKGLPAGLEACVISHERKHAAGYRHDLERPNFAIDCGDGTRWMPHG